MRNGDWLDNAPMPMMAALAALVLLASLLVRGQGKRLLTLPLVRNFIFMMSVLVINQRFDPEHRRYSSDIGGDDASCITLGGIPFEVDLDRPAKTDRYALPLLRKLIAPENNFGLIVSMVQPHELSGDGISLFGFKRRPVQPAAWREWGMDYINVPVQDFTADFDLESTLKALAAMRAVVDSGKRVYVHCQAGEGRGFIMTMCYLLTHGLPTKNEAGTVLHQRMNYAEALQRVKLDRPHVSESPERRALIEAVADVWHQHRPDAPGVVGLVT